MTGSLGNSVMQELRTSYLRSLAGKWDEFAEAATQRRFPTIVRIGHQMKGSGLSYGMPKFSDIGVRIEEAGENRRVLLLDSLLAEFKVLLKEAAEEMSPPEKK